MKNLIKQIGQGMTEYIIIVALIAIAGIGAFTFFSDGMKDAIGGVTSELTGGTAAVTESVGPAGTQGQNMSTYQGQNAGGGDG
jgi:Flp pilus assembly pilin Flp